MLQANSARSMELLDHCIFKMFRRALSSIQTHTYLLRKNLQVVDFKKKGLANALRLWQKRSHEIL